MRLRVTSPPATGRPDLAEWTLQPLAWSATREAVAAAVARDARRGLYPRGCLDEQVYWTVVGADRDPREGLLSEDGALETGPGGVTVEPFLWADGRLVTWADVTSEASLADGDLPVPSVTWRAGPWRLVITAVGVGEPGQSSLLARYRLTNTGPVPAAATL